MSSVHLQMYTQHYSCVIVRDLASDSSTRLFGRPIVIWDGQENDHFGPYLHPFSHFSHFGQFWMGTTVQKYRQFWNPSKVPGHCSHIFSATHAVKTVILTCYSKRERRTAIVSDSQTLQPIIGTWKRIINITVFIHEIQHYTLYMVI